MLHLVNAATIVQEARLDAGLSRAELARRAGVPRSTVTRMEDGLVDPTFGMLQRVLGAAHAALEVSAQPLPTLSLARLSDARSDTPWGETIDWTRLRATIDELMLHPDAVEAAITTPPARSGSARLDALLAGIAEKLADDAALPRSVVVQDGSRAHRALGATRHSMDGRPHDRDRARSTAPPQHLPR